MGNTIILTKNHPSELRDIEKAESFQISLLGGPTGEQRVREEHGWWNERDQKAEWLAVTLAPDTPYPFQVARNLYFRQILNRVQEGFVHSRSYSFTEERFVYRDLTNFKLESAAGMG